jgi:hypothetical protein
MNPPELLNQVFHLLDRLIHDHGNVLFALCVYVAIPIIAWLLGRRSGRKKLRTSHTFILVIKPPTQSTGIPPVIRWEFEPPSDDDSGPLGGL